MGDHICYKEDIQCASDRVTAARNLARLLTKLSDGDTGHFSATTVPTQGLEYATAIPVKSYIEIISAIQALVPTLSFEKPIFATFHDGEVHDPLGGGAYAFKDDLVEPVLLALINDEASSKGEICPWADNKDKKKYAKRDSETNNDGGTGLTNPLPTRDIIIHAGVQPNNSPHAGTLVVFCYAFSFARSILNRMEATVAHTDHRLPRVSVEITFVDTAPVNSHGIEIDGIQYQKSYRNVPGALGTFMADYEEVLSILSTWSNIPFTIAFQSDFFSQPIIPSLLQYVIAHHDILGSQLSPKYKKLALRASCPVLGCGLAEKHGRLNVYNGFDSSYEDSTMDSTSSRAMVTFHCPHHGPHFIRISEPAEVARLEANAPVRNLIRSMSYLLDTGRHHVRITGADYAGMYQEVFLYRPLAVWSAVTGLATGRTPHILYAPLIVDWSGAKLSKALYIDEGGYDVMKLLGADGLLSYAQLKSEFGGDGEEGLRRIWEEVQRWVADPRKLFRMFSVEYLHRVIVSGRHWVL